MGNIDRGVGVDEVRYLAGVIYEDEGNKDSAFIDYQEALKLNPSLATLAAPVIRLARETGRNDAAAELSARYPAAVADAAPAGRGRAIVVVANPLRAEKRGQNRGGEGGELIAVPVFRARGGARRANVSVAGQNQTAATVTNLGSVAVLHLEDRVGKLVAKQLAAMVVKGGLAVAAGAPDQERGGRRVDLPTCSTPSTSLTCAPGCRCPPSSRWRASASRPANTRSRCVAAAG